MFFTQVKYVDVRSAADKFMKILLIVLLLLQSIEHWSEAQIWSCK